MVVIFGFYKTESVFEEIYSSVIRFIKIRVEMN